MNLIPKHQTCISPGTYGRGLGMERALKLCQIRLLNHMQQHLESTAHTHKSQKESHPMVCLAEKWNRTYLYSQTGEDNWENTGNFQKYLG